MEKQIFYFHSALNSPNSWFTYWKFLSGILISYELTRLIRAKQKNLAMGKKKFNMESKKGVQFLISHNLVVETPEEVAQFLYKEEGLNKTVGANTNTNTNFDATFRLLEIT